MHATIALMYHALGASTVAADPHYTVTAQDFTHHMRCCRVAGGAIVSTRDWLEGHPGVIVTFDDGHESNYHVGVPLLAELGGTADFFVNPVQVGTPGFATWAQLREMADAGHSIQSHGLDHGHYLTALSPSALREELKRARLEIEEHVGRAVTLLAPPGGRCPPRLDRVAHEVGYTHVLTSKPGTITRGHRSLLPRLAVTAGLASETLESWLRGGPALLRARARYSLLALAKSALGDSTYENLRRRALGK